MKRKHKRPEWRRAALPFASLQSKTCCENCFFAWKVLEPDGRLALQTPDLYFILHVFWHNQQVEQSLVKKT